MKRDTRVSAQMAKPFGTATKTEAQGRPNGRGGVASEPVPAKPLVREERRRSQRVLLRTRAQIYIALGGKHVTIDAFTLSVNPQGALVVMKQSLPVDARLVLEHGITKERVACKVVRPGQETPEGFHVPLEFDSPMPEFWRIAFPPADWRADDEQNS